LDFDAAAAKSISDVFDCAQALGAAASCGGIEEQEDTAHGGLGGVAADPFCDGADGYARGAFGLPGLGFV